MKRHLSEAAVAKIMEHLLERFGEPIGNTVSDRQAVTDERGGKPKKGKLPKNSNRGWGAKFEAVTANTCDQCGGMMGMDQCCTGCGAMPTAMDGATGAVPGTAIVIIGDKNNPGINRQDQPSKGISPYVHPPQGMDGIQTPSSGRSAAKHQVAGAGPKPMPASLDSFKPEVMSQASTPSSSGGSSSPPPTSPPPPSSSPPPSGGGSSPPPSMDEMDEEMNLDEKAPPGREKQVRTLKKKKGIDNPFAVAWASYNKSHGDE
jgi:hypothetical protein